MLTCVSDYEYYGGDLLSAVECSGHIIPFADSISCAQALRLEDASYLVESFTGIINSGHMQHSMNYPFDRPVMWQTSLGYTWNYLATLKNQLSAALSSQNQTSYCVNKYNVFLLNHFDTLPETENVYSTSVLPYGTQNQYYKYIFDNRMTLSTLPDDRLSGIYYNVWLAGQYPISADYARLMYHYLLSTKIGRGIMDNAWNDSTPRNWFGWTLQSHNKWLKSWRDKTYYESDYRYGNGSFGDSNNLRWTYYQDGGQWYYSNTCSWQTIDEGNRDDCYMFFEGQNTSQGAEFTLSRPPEGNVYYLWGIEFDNTNVGTGSYQTRIPYTYNGLSAGTIMRLERLLPVEGDTTGCKFKATYYGNSSYLTNLAQTMGFDMGTVGTKNTSYDGEHLSSFVRRAGLRFSWSNGLDNMLFCSFDEPYYIHEGEMLPWDWTPEDWGQNEARGSDQPRNLDDEDEEEQPRRGSFINDLNVGNLVVQKNGE